MKDKIVCEWYLECIDSAANKNKFYEILIWFRDNSFYISRRFGRIGTNTKAKEIHTFKTIEAAQAKAQELVSGKRFSKKDQYTLVKQIDNSNVMDAPQITTKPKADVKQVVKQKKITDTDFWGGLSLA
ncbi:MULTISPECIES: WGR domain-containing protein [unclassified Pseudoalteromonas]|uniref:WGR domain-containing protein n=1 Tax=unclassified Pseudoalteromonas TaxID=194690 RepID=UPI000416EE14|nr:MULTISPECIES: WGR domain-containing protein [unclassified Pseudoalteromonas]